MAETFETLKLKIASWLNIASTKRLAEDVRGDCINMAMRRLMKKYTLRFGEATDTDDLTASAWQYALPDRFVKFYSLWYVPSSGGIKYLEYAPKDEFDAAYPDPTENPAGPEIYTVWGGVYQVAPQPDDAYTLNQNYHQYLTDLEDGDNNTNAFVAAAWEAIFFRALLLATKFLNEDVRVPLWDDESKAAEEDLAAEHRWARSTRQPKSKLSS